MGVTALSARPRPATVPPLSRRARGRMPRPKTTIDPEAIRATLDELANRLQHVAENDEADPFDDAMLSAIFGLVELSKTQATMLASLESAGVKLARKTR